MRAQEHNTRREKKQHMHPKFSSANLRPKFLQFSPIFLSTQLTRQRKRKKWSRLPKVRALCSFPTIALFLSLSLSLFCSFFFAFVFFLFLLSRCVCVCVCVCVCLERPDLRLGVLFPSQPQVFFSCSHVLTFPLFIISHHLLIQFAASAPATSADRPWP